MPGPAREDAGAGFAGLLQRQSQEMEISMAGHELRGAAAIVGFGDYYFKADEELSALHLARLAVRAALADAGLEKEDIDGVLSGREPSGDERPQWQNILCAYLKMTPTYSSQITIHSAGMNSMLK